MDILQFMYHNLISVYNMLKSDRISTLLGTMVTPTFYHHAVIPMLPIVWCWSALQNWPHGFHVRILNLSFPNNECLATLIKEFDLLTVTNVEKSLQIMSGHAYQRVWLTDCHQCGEILAKCMKIITNFCVIKPHLAGFQFHMTICWTLLPCIICSLIFRKN